MILKEEVESPCSVRPMSSPGLASAFCLLPPTHTHPSIRENALFATALPGDTAGRGGGGPWKALPSPIAEGKPLCLLCLV